MYANVLFSKPLQKRDTVKICDQQSILKKNQILIVALQNSAKINFKNFCKNLSFLFFHDFFRNVFQTDVIQALKKFSIFLHHKSYLVFTTTFTIFEIKALVYTLNLGFLSFYIQHLFAFFNQRICFFTISDLSELKFNLIFNQ